MRDFLFALLLAGSPVLAAEARALSSAECDAAAVWNAHETPRPVDLAGIWDFEVLTGSAPSRGVMALGQIEDHYAGAVTPEQTNTVAIRKLTLVGAAIHLAVWSRDGDVVFAGKLLADGKTMCGIIDYHEGRRFPMVARQRPNAYRDNRRND